MSLPPLLLAPYPGIASRIAERLASSRAGTDAFAPWSEDVLVASHGLAQAIAAALVERIPAGITALRLQTIERLAQSILNDAGDYPHVATDAERRLAMRAAARAVSDPMTETRGAAAMLERSYRDVRDGGQTIAEFAARLKKLSSLRNRSRLHTVIRVWEEYERLLTRLGAIDPADLLSKAAERIRSGAAVPPQILAGFYDLTGAQWNVVRALQDVEKLAAVFVPTDSPFARPLIEKFGNVTAGAPHIPIRKEQWTVSESRTREDEIRAVCESIAGLLAEGVAPQRIGITARALDPYDLHLFERFSRQAGFAVSTGAGTPLLAHRFGRTLAMLMRLRDRDFPRADVLEISRSGLRLHTKINSDKADLETRRATIAGGRSGPIRDRAGSSLVLADYASLVEELEQLTERIDASFAARVAQQFRMQDESDLAAVSAIEEIADLFKRAERWNRPFDAGAFLDALNEVTLSQQPTTNYQQPMIWAGDVMRLRGRSFDLLFAVRMQDDLLPQRRTEDPLLPDSDRRQLDIREIGNGRDEEQLLFQLMRGTSATHFSYASSDGFGKPLRPSQLLKAFAIEQEPGAKSEILKNFSRFILSAAKDLRCSSDHRAISEDAPEILRFAQDRLRRPLQLLTLAGTRSPFDGYISSPLVRERATAALQAVSPTQLEDFGECPQKFLFKHILRVFDIDDPEREVQINHREKGTIDHSILERFYRGTSEEEIQGAALSLPVLPDSLRDRLEQCVDEVFDEFEARIPPFNRAMRLIERRATKRVLRDFVAADIAELIAFGLAPRQYEYRFGAKHRPRHEPDHREPFVLDTRGIRLRVEGTIDRIDEGQGQFRIVDYKSGKAGRHQNLAEKIDRGVRLQLALYAMAVADFFKIPAAEITGTIKAIGAPDADPELFAFDLGDKEARLRDTLAIFVEAIVNGKFPAFPNESANDFQSCKYCPVNHSCRTRHDVEEQRTALQWDEPRSMLEQGP
jgi:RecB family exonuclease